jgi:hypothetical protein
MPDDDRELQRHWEELAERISKERSRSKIIGLTQELIDMLDKHSRERNRLKESA